MKKIYGLDTLRAFAIFFVIIEHWGPEFPSKSISSIVKISIVPNGNFGVTLFFVLSGFLITSILLKAKNINSNKIYEIKTFFIRRALRIFPIYYILIILLFVFNYPGIQSFFIFYFTYTSNILVVINNCWNSLSHTWSLAVEEQFYLLWPWLVIFIDSKYLAKVFIVFILIGISTSFIVSNIYGRIPVLVFNCFDAFGIGALYANYRNNNNHIVIFEKTIRRLFFPAITIYFIIKVMIFYDSYDKIVFLERPIDSIISMYVIMLIINNKSKFIDKYILCSRLLNYIGKISYGLYLYHFPLIHLYRMFINKYCFQMHAIPTIFANFYFSYAIKLIILVLVSIFSYEVIEIRFLKLKSHFEYNKKNTQ